MDISIHTSEKSRRRIDAIANKGKMTAKKGKGPRWPHAGHNAESV
jgi:hypothetical protein